MKTMRRNRLLPGIGLFLAVFTWLANNDNPPDGKTAAPFDGSCNECHSGGNFNGTVTVNGLPDPIEPSTTYPLVITLTPTAGTPIRGGFQLVVVDGDNNNAGDLIPGNAQSGTDFFGGREYLESRVSKNFTGGGPMSYSFNWKSPVAAAGNSIKFYYMGCFADGDETEAGDIGLGEAGFYTFDEVVGVNGSGYAGVGLNLSPNPASDVLNLLWNTGYWPVYGRIIDGQGRRSMELTREELSHPVRVSHLPAGWYVLIIEFNNGYAATLPWVKGD